MSTTLVSLELQGAEKILAQLEAVHNKLRELGYGGGPGGPSGGGGFATGAPDIAHPTVNPTTLSPAAAAAGTPAAASVGGGGGGGGATAVGGGSQGGVTPPPLLPHVQAVHKFGNIMGQVIASHQMLDFVNTQAGHLGQSVATGAPYQPQNMISGGLQLGSLAGFAIGGPWGLAVGATLAAGAAFAEPQIKQSIANERYARTHEALYGRAPSMSFSLPMAEAMEGFAQSGHPMSVEMAEYLGGRDDRTFIGKGMDEGRKALAGLGPLGGAVGGAATFMQGRDLLRMIPGFGHFAGMLPNEWVEGRKTRGIALDGREKEFAEAFNRAAYSPTAINALGRVVSMDKEASFEDFMDVAGAIRNTDPYGVLVMGAKVDRKQLTPDQVKVLDATLEQSKTRLESLITNQTDLQAFSSDLSTSLSAQSRAAHSGGQAGFMGASAQVRSDLAKVTAILRKEAAFETDPELRASKLRKIQDLEAESNFSQLTQDFQMGMDESSSLFELLSGNTGRAFEKALYSGATWDRVGFEQQAQVAMAQSRDITERANAGRASGAIGPAEYNRMLNEAADLNQQATVGIPRAREQMRNESIMLGGQERGLDLIAANQSKRLYGSAVDQAGGGYDTAANLREQKAAMEEILRTSEKLTDSERRRLEMGVKQLEIQAKQSEAQAAWGQLQAGLSTGLHDLTMGGSEATLKLIRGVGGMGAFEAKQELVNISKGKEALIEGKITQALKTHDPKSNEVRALQQQLYAQQIETATQEASLTLVPMSAHNSIKLMDLETEKMAMQSGFAGGPGAIRANIMAQMDTIKGHLGELDQMAAKMGGVDKMTDGQRVKYHEQRNMYTRQLIGLQDEYDNGAFERIIAQAMNMGGGPGVTLAQAQYNRRTAAESGQDTMYYGGNSAWAQKQLGRTIRLMNVAGAATPEGALRAAGVEGDRVLKIEVEVKQGGQIIGQKNATLQAGQELVTIFGVSPAKTD